MPSSARGAGSPAGAPPIPRTIAPASRVEAFALRTIVLFKVVKCASMLLLALALFDLVGRDVRAVAEAVAHFLRLDVHGAAIAALLSHVADLRPKEIVEAAVAALLYSGVLAAEAIGLHRRRAWAAWLSVAVGGAFLPVELREMWLHPRPRLAAAIAVNLAVVLYLAHEARRSRLAPAAPTA